MEIPEPQGHAAQINMFCETSHASYLTTCRSKACIIFFINGETATYYSEMQNMIDELAEFRDLAGAPIKG